MDPDAALKELREKMNEMQRIIDSGAELDDSPEGEAFVEAANRAIDLWAGLDNWMTTSGALPADWAKGR